jgi:hypothetical protein
LAAHFVYLLVEVDVLGEYHYLWDVSKVHNCQFAFDDQQDAGLNGEGLAS